MKARFRRLISPAVGLLGAMLLGLLYFGIVSLAESPRHAMSLFWEDRQFVIPILLGFGIQAGLYSILKLRLYLPGGGAAIPTGAPAAGMGAGGTTSMIAMVACCAHHVADALPILGLTAAATFLANYKTAFMAAGLATNLIGISVMVVILLKARRQAATQLVNPSFGLGDA